MSALLEALIQWLLLNICYIQGIFSQNVFAEGIKHNIAVRESTVYFECQIHKKLPIKYNAINTKSLKCY